MISKKGKKIIASEDDFSFKPKTKITWQGSVAIRIDSKNMITINLFPLEKETRFSSQRGFKPQWTTKIIWNSTIRGVEYNML
jgi:hypothetical protein